MERRKDEPGNGDSAATPAKPIENTLPAGSGLDRTLAAGSNIVGSEETVMAAATPTIDEEALAEGATVAPGSEASRPSHVVIRSNAIPTKSIGEPRAVEHTLGAGSGGDGITLPIVDDRNYERLDEFARGGLGRISKARDLRTGRIVALKEMLGSAEEAAQRFAREARVTANLMHPAIVPVYELGRWPSGEPFFAMKLVEGKSLQQVAQQCKNLEERLGRLDVIVAVADALAYAHQAHVIHRDLKPANILVGEFGETVVIDWGLAKVLDEDEVSIVQGPASRTSQAVIDAGSIGERTMDGSVLGTPSYMPPEQALGNKADERADVYAIGAMLYHLITGVTPFSDQKPRDVGTLLRMVENDPPTPVATLAPEVPPDLVTIIEKAMARDKSERYPSAKELADDLRRFTNGQLVSAHRYDWKALVKRWLRRHRATVTVAAALVAILIVGAIYSVRSIIQERDAAEQGRRDAVAAEERATKGTEAARKSLATALFQKGKSAEQNQRWADAAMYYAASRKEHDTKEARWFGGLAESKSIVPATRHIGHKDVITASAISPDSDRVITVDASGEARMWKRADGVLLVAKKLPSPLWSVAFSPDGKELAVGGDDGVIRRLTQHLDQIGTLEGHAKRVWSVVYSPDGSQLASGGEDTLARIWTIATGASKPLAGHTQRVYSVSFSPDGKQLATGSDDRTLYLWDLAKGTGTKRGAQENGGIRAVEFTRKGDAVAAGGWDYDIKVWPVAPNPPAAWSDRLSVHDIAVSPDGRVVISVGDSGELRFWEVATHNLITAIDLPTAHMSTVQMSNDGRWLVTGGNDRVPVVWDIAALPRLLDAIGHTRTVNRVSTTSDSTRAVSSGDDGTLRLWDLANGAELLQIPWPSAAGKRTYCTSPYLSVKLGVIVTPCEDLTLRRWDLTGRPLGVAKTDHYLRIASLAPDDTTFAAGHMKGFLAVFDLTKGAFALPERQIHGHQMYGVHYGATGQLVTGSLDNTAKLWSPQLALVREFKIDGEDGVLHVALSPDGKLVGAGAQDGTVYIWNAATGERLAKNKQHVGAIWGFDFSPDGKLVYTFGDDGTLRVWDTATWQVIDKLEAKAGVGGPLSMTADGKTLVTGFANGSLVVWDAATRKVRFRIGGNARDFGSCDDVSTQRWVDDAHRGLVDAACKSAPGAYLDKIQRFTQRKIVNDVDVVVEWATPSP